MTQNGDSRPMPTEEQRLALEMRKAGATYKTIALKLCLPSAEDAQAAVLAALTWLTENPDDPSWSLEALGLARREDWLIGLTKRARRGERPAIEKLEALLDAAGPGGAGGIGSADAAGLFPAPAAAPGQAESREGYAALQAAGRRGEIPWWADFVAIRERLAERRAANQIARADWRIAAFLAWSSSPIVGRWPATQEEMATRVLGLRGDRAIRKWRRLYPWIDEEIAYWQAAPLLAHRRDVFEALVTVARQKDPKAHPDRRLLLEMTGDYKPRQAVEQSGPGGGPIEFKRAEELSDDELATLAAGGDLAGDGSEGVDQAADGAA